MAEIPSMLFLLPLSFPTPHVRHCEEDPKFWRGNPVFPAGQLEKFLTFFVIPAKAGNQQ